jgi:hypothetical protein
VWKDKTESVSVKQNKRRLSPIASDFRMASKRPKPVTRKPRADAQRNRARILKIAKDAFSRSGANISLDDVARQARIGAGT